MSADRPPGHDAEPVAICIVTYNSAADLPDCLEAVGNLRYRPLELVVVDCASGDGSADVAERSAPPGLPCRVIRLDENRGFSGGMNVAIAQVEAAYILSLNSDALPEPDYVDRLVARSRAHPELRVGAVTGRLVRPAAGARSPKLDACGMRLASTWRHLDRGSDEPDRGQLRRAERVFGATGAASLFVRGALDDVALAGEHFLEEFHSFREDAELCFRLRERGFEVLYEPMARAVHRRHNLPRRRREMSPHVNFHSLKNRYLLRLYHQRWLNLLLTLVPCLWRDALALGYVLLRERSSLAAYGWLWRNRRRLLARRRALVARSSQPAAAVNRWFWRQSLPLP